MGRQLGGIYAHVCCLIGVIPTLLLFRQPFGINALVGLIALSGILMRNTLIPIGQIRTNEKEAWRHSMPWSKPPCSAPGRSS